MLLGVTSRPFSNTCSDMISNVITIPRLGDIFTASSRNGASSFWTINTSNNNTVNIITNNVRRVVNENEYYGVRPVVQLKANTVISSGGGTRDNPFKIALK